MSSGEHSPPGDSDALHGSSRRGTPRRLEQNELSIAFVVANALSGTMLGARRLVIHLPRPTPVRGGAGT